MEQYKMRMAKHISIAFDILVSFPCLGLPPSFWNDCDSHKKTLLSYQILLGTEILHLHKTPSWLKGFTWFSYASFRITIWTTIFKEFTCSSLNTTKECYFLFTAEVVYAWHALNILFLKSEGDSWKFCFTEIQYFLFSIIIFISQI